VKVKAATAPASTTPKCSTRCAKRERILDWVSLRAPVQRVLPALSSVEAPALSSFA
jgi:hypothetical protein